MKKTYKNPTLKVVKTKGARLLAGSAQGTLTSTSITARGGFGARRAEFSDWDEEE